MSLSVLSLTRLEKELSGGGLLGKGRASFDGQQWVSRPEMLRNVLCSGRVAPRPVANSTVSASSASHLSKRRLGWPSCSLLSRPYISFLCVDGGTLLVGFLFFFSSSPHHLERVLLFIPQPLLYAVQGRVCCVYIFFKKRPLFYFFSFHHRFYSSNVWYGREKKESIGQPKDREIFFLLLLPTAVLCCWIVSIIGLASSPWVFFRSSL